jgi:D-alanyl-D-alanine carboxypeptidase
MFHGLKQKFLIKTLDFFLFFLLFLGRVFSLKGLYQATSLVLLFFILGRGSFIESKEVFLFSHVYQPYVKLSKDQEPKPLLKEGALTSFPRLNSRSALVVDLKTSVTLYANNPSERMAPASTTKLMTALISKEIYSLEEIVEVPSKCAGVWGMTLGLNAGEELVYKDLLHALLISSSNDVACTLANGKIPQEEFVFLMNEKASNLSLTNTNFTNPIGFDSPDFAHYSSAEDLYQLALVAREDPLIREICSKSTYRLSTGQFPRRIYSTNYLLDQIEGTVGIKTGTTNQAGEVFIYEYLDPSENENFLIVLMGSNNRFGETRRILNWLQLNYQGA